MHSIEASETRQMLIIKGLFIANMLYIENCLPQNIYLFPY